jgi:two-component system chemotaxis response regulator CheY
MKILIVDDSSAMRKIIQRSLRLAGFEGHQVTEADNGAVALELIRNDSPDLILSDWNMPQLSGIELLRSIRSEGRNIPFGFVTTESTPDMRTVAHDAGAQFLLAKPFTPEEMAGVLRSAVKTV